MDLEQVTSMDRLWIYLHDHKRLGSVVGARAIRPDHVRVREPGKGNSNLPWREAGPLNHHDDIVDSDQ